MGNVVVMFLGVFLHVYSFLCLFPSVLVLVLSLVLGTKIKLETTKAFTLSIYSYCLCVVQDQINSSLQIQNLGNLRSGHVTHNVFEHSAEYNRKCKK